METLNLFSLFRVIAMQQISAGQLLCGGLFSTDCLSHWLSSVALSHALVNNTNNRELLLRVHLAIAKDVAPVSLLQQAFSILQLVNFLIQIHLELCF